jgi:hypothetical protein
VPAGPHPPGPGLAPPSGTVPTDGDSLALQGASTRSAGQLGSPGGDDGGFVINDRQGKSWLEATAHYYSFM